MVTPTLRLINHKDIQIFDGDIAFSSGPFYCSSLEGKRAISDVFEILEFVAVVGTTNTFVLQELDETGKPLPNIFQQDATGNLKAGRYMIQPVEKGAEVYRRLVTTFAVAGGKQTDEYWKPEKKPEEAKLSDTESVSSTVSERGDDPRGFKMRLVHRDKGCVVCHAMGTDSIYRYRDDSSFFEGSHIFPFAMQSLWSARKYGNLITDPFTAPSVENAARNKQDPLRINSLENGMLLCLFHHKAYETLRFSIHHTTHRIFAFHPAVAHLHGLEVTSPWKVTSAIYPAPHKELLKAHYQTSVFSSVELLDDNDDDSGLLIPPIHNEAIRIWAEDPNQWPPAEWALDTGEVQDKSQA